MRGLLHLSPGAECSLSSYHNSAASEMLECQPEIYWVYQVWAAEEEFICRVFFSESRGEWCQLRNGILHTKMFNKNIFNASHLHSSRFILPPLVLNKFLITGADNLNSVSWFPRLGLCVKSSLSLQRRQWQFREERVVTALLQ